MATEFSMKAEWENWAVPNIFLRSGVMVTDFFREQSEVENRKGIKWCWKGFP